jgi:hypothetical protein
VNDVLAKYMRAATELVSRTFMYDSGQDDDVSWERLALAGALFGVPKYAFIRDQVRGEASGRQQERIVSRLTEIDRCHRAMVAGHAVVVGAAAQAAPASSTSS